MDTNSNNSDINNEMDHSMPNPSGLSLPLCHADTASKSGLSSPTNLGHSLPADSQMTNLMSKLFEQQTQLLRTVQNTLGMDKGNEEAACSSKQASKDGNEKESFPPLYDIIDSSEDNNDDEEKDSDDDDDDDLLQSINNLYDNQDNTGDAVNGKLAKSVNLSFRSMLSKEHQVKINEKLKRPENCENMTVPRVNVEVWEQAKMFHKTKDLQLGKVQSLLCKAAVPITEMANVLLDKNNSKGKGVTINKCTDALVMMTAAFTELSQLRKENLKSVFPVQYRNRLSSKDNQVSTNWLFGDDLPKKIKEITDTKSIADKLSIRKPHPTPRFKPYYTKHDGSKGKKTGKNKSFSGKSPRNYSRFKEGF